MPSDKKRDQLSINKVPAELKDRVDAKAALLGKLRDAWVIELLQEATEDMVEVQKKVLREYELKKKRKNRQNDRKNEYRMD